MKKLILHTPLKTVPIYFIKELLKTEKMEMFCRDIGSFLVIITHNNLVSKFAQCFLEKFAKRTILLSFPEGERYKTRNIKQRLEDKMLTSLCGRDSVILAIGGGVVLDVAGFIAATYQRGIPSIYVPTTLLAMVDAAIGGKVGVNTKHGKNMIGCIHHPEAIFIDPTFLKTLSEGELKNGIAEMIKGGIVAKRELFFNLQKISRLQREEAFLEKLIFDSCKIKKDIVEQDIDDRGVRQILNFGHTIGHGLEKASLYTMSHGEAIAWGMAVESYISYRLKLLKRSSFRRIVELLQGYKLLPLLRDIDNQDVMRALAFDKKCRDKKLRFVLIEDIGKSYFNRSYTHEVSQELIYEALSWMKKGVNCSNFWS